jgi:hypothetical protein
MVVPLIGDVDRSSGRPGERIAIKVSSQFDAPCRANMVRIVHADANPAAPWPKSRDLELVIGEAPCNSSKYRGTAVRGLPALVKPDSRYL